MTSDNNFDFLGLIFVTEKVTFLLLFFDGPICVCESVVRWSGSTTVVLCSVQVGLYMFRVCVLCWKRNQRSGSICSSDVISEL